MKRIIAVILSLLPIVSSATAVRNHCELVDTRVGTASAITRTAGMFGKGSEEHGQTLPAAGVPHGMNLWTPQTRDTEKKCVAPYYYTDSLLQGFRNSHWIVGGCTQDYGSMTLQALSGRFRTSPSARATRLDHNRETARPDYYAVTLPDEGIRAEVTGLSHAGIFRFNYDADGTGHLVVNPNSDEGEGFIEIDTLRREIRGCNPVHRIYQGKGEYAGFNGWFVVRYPEDLKVTGFGTFKGDTILAGTPSVSNQPNIGGYISFDVSKEKPVTVTVGSSFTSMDAARRNLLAEIPVADFGKVRDESQRQWEQRFSTIEVEEGTPDDIAKFYGSLYRCSILPRVASDVDGAYVSFAGSREKPSEIRYMPAGHDYYDDYSMWDTYRALHPLLTIIDPVRSADMMQSLIIKGQQGGWMPIFPCWNSYTAAMIGDHCAVTLADAALKGIPFDYESAYALLRKNAFETPATYKEYADGMGRRALDSYIKYGYIPMEDGVSEAYHKREQSSRTLEYAFDDFALAQLAFLLISKEEKTPKALKDFKVLKDPKVLKADEKVLRKRALNYRNVYDPKLGYVNGRHADGTFAEGTDPFTFNPAITEGAPCHYTWYVPHDPKGLVKMLGGKKKFEAKLDSMFSEGRYWHGNEPCHQVAWLYNLVGRRDKTAATVQHIMDTEYLNAPGGLSGNDDAGQMSAWYVFGALGFYPVAPATNEYYLGKPRFPRIVLNLPGAPSLTITPAAATNPGLTTIPHRRLLTGQPLAF